MSKVKKIGLDELESRYVAAKDALTAGLNREYPVGSKVYAWMSRGYMYGTVTAETRSDSIIVASENTGRVHHKHFSLVKKG